VAKIPAELAAQAVAHPVRAAILKRLGEQVRSATSIGDELGVDNRLVAYHFERLRALGAIEQTGEAPQVRAGRREQLYRALWRVRVEVEPVE
jgi:predicted ArsR family transcriptional regulator